MTEWQQQRAVLVADRDRLLLAAAAYEGAALNDIDPVRTQASERAAQYTASAAALTAALALADRAAELEAALAEERAEAAVVQAWGESEAQSKVELFFMLSQHRAARAAQRNAAQQEGHDGA